MASIWSIWYSRNIIIFHDEFLPISHAIRSICRAVKEVEFFKLGHMSNSVADLSILARFRIAAIPHKHPVTFPVQWFPPPNGWLKINSDGAALGSPGI